MRMTKHILMLSSALLLAGCFGGASQYEKTAATSGWVTKSDTIARTAQADTLKNWWLGFEDENLNALVAEALSDSPDRNIAMARITEARGLRRSTRSSLFPQIGASAQIGRADNGSFGGAGGGADDVYDAAFDASYEIDVFGQNRAQARASDDNLTALQFAYDHTSLTLIGDVVRNYIDMRRFEKQVRIAERNLYSQEKTLELVRNLMEVGEATSLDAQRSENLVNTTRASIPAYKAQADAARFALSVLTGKTPQDLVPMIALDKTLPSANFEPVLMTPSNVIANRPDVNAAAAALSAQSNLSYAAMVDIFPSFTLSGLYGITRSTFVDRTNIWSLAAGTAVSLIDFGRIRGAIDAQRAVEEQVYQAYRKAVLSATAEVETALSDYLRITEAKVSLAAAFENARETLRLSQLLYEEGEISFLDILEAQRTLNNADTSLVDAEANSLQALTRLYKALGVY